MIIKASHILSMEAPLFTDAFIRIVGDQILEIGKTSLLPKNEINEEVIELNKSLLMPGFVNAHCHLELTCLQPLAFSKNPPSFVKWIQEVVRKKNLAHENEITQGIANGIDWLMKSGVTTLGDHISFNTPWKSILSSPLRGILFGEVLGVMPEICQDIYNHWQQLKTRIQKKSSRFSFRISPHSVHAVDPATLKDVVTREPPPLSCHLAESQAEKKYFKEKAGDMMELLKKRGILPTHDSASGLMHLKEEGLPLSKLLLVHGNYLTDEEIDLMTTENNSLVYCPGSHRYFGHDQPPLLALLKKGINIALGTDSLASNTQLNFLMELRLMKEAFSFLSCEQILKMATLNGAKALRMDQEIGSIKLWKKADLIGFKIPQGMDPLEAVFQAKQADFVMIDGGLPFTSF